MGAENDTSCESWLPYAVHDNLAVALRHASKLSARTGRMHRIVKNNNASFSVVDEAAWEAHDRELRLLRGETVPDTVPPAAKFQRKVVERERFSYIGFGSRVGVRLVPGDEWDDGSNDQNE